MPIAGVQPNIIDQVRGGAQAQSQLAPLEAQLAEANALRGFQMPEGRQAGNVYMAANPLEMLASAVRGVGAEGRYNELNDQVTPLRDKAANLQGAMFEAGLQQSQAQNLRGEKAASPANWKREFYQDKEGNVHTTLVNPETRELTYQHNGQPVGDEIQGWMPYDSRATDNKQSASATNALFKQQRKEEEDMAAQKSATSLFGSIVGSEYANTAMGSGIDPQVALTTFGAKPYGVDIFLPESMELTEEQIKGGSALRLEANQFNLEAIAPTLEKLGVNPTDLDLKVAQATKPSAGESLETWLKWGDSTYQPAIQRALDISVKKGTTTQAQADQYMAQMNVEAALGYANLYISEGKDRKLTQKQFDAIRQSGKMEEMAKAGDPRYDALYKLMMKNAEGE